MLLVSAGMFWSGYSGFSKGDGHELGLGIGSGGVFLILAVNRFWDIRQSKRDGRDHTIIRVKGNGS